MFADSPGAANPADAFGEAKNKKPPNSAESLLGGFVALRRKASLPSKTRPRKARLGSKYKGDVASVNTRTITEKRCGTSGR